MTDTELNESLLKKIGFKPCVNGTWGAPDKSGYFGPLTVPDLPNDLSACFKWLVPELRKQKMTSIMFHFTQQGAYCSVAGYNKAILQEWAVTESTALCLVADKFLR